MEVFTCRKACQRAVLTPFMAPGTVALLEIFHMVTAVAIVYIRRLDFALIRRNSVIRVTLETVRKDLALMRVRGELIDVDMRVHRFA